ncbi:MAG TPA: hypothetical protein PK829_14155, partial [Promineifilum sp.]|nr:hypothetical protein [Promineifilum sp.]
VVPPPQATSAIAPKSSTTINRYHFVFFIFPSLIELNHVTPVGFYVGLADVLGNKRFFLRLITSIAAAGASDSQVYMNAKKSISALTV